ncbi:hypothetical protein VP1G_07294 [Cytospora mali]|uniref:Ubiquitin-like domain-containing protein n=1 Tax=Cytospora mali TaxID=578113 RepID=A0A194V7U4_CYTMA|nr:hypothetical protein VP1G_07294 [Valsa mali var. pyri (nom. inval.)]
MAAEATSSSAVPPPEENELSVNISIVSPSVAVNAPLSFPGLPASTTVAQLKERIRDALDSKPSNEQQRLIHQGKLLSRENETLLDVFGEQKLRDSDQIAVHLVIRDLSDLHPPAGQTAASQGQSPVPNPNTRVPSVPSALNPQRAPHNHHQPLLPSFGRPTPLAGQPHQPFTGPGFGMAAPANPAAAQMFASQQQILQQYRAQLNQRPIVNPGHHPRTSIWHNVAEPAGMQQFPVNHGQGRNSPRPEYQGHVRETIGPNGEVIRVMTNSAFIAPNGQVFPLNLQQGHAAAPAPAPGGPFSTNDVQNIMRNADASQATSMMTDAMQRSASGASLANLNLSNQRQPIQTPGVTVSRRPSSTVPMPPLSRAATPDPTRTASYGSASAPPQTAMRSSTPNQPEVYILNSPQGPRALLINNLSDLYYTPAARYPMAPIVPSFSSPWIQPQPQPRSGPSTDNTHQAGQPQPAAGAAPQQAPQQGNIRVNLYQGPAAQQQGRQQQQPQIQPLARAHPGNPEAGMAGALIAALWPHIWLMIRLAVFVWWFTSSETSWMRWFTIMSVATAVFLINTGLLNGIANHMFNPVRQHLEGLIPLGGLGPNINRDGDRNNAQAAAQDGGNNGQAPQPQQQQGQPDPAGVAARLVAQRQQQNANWLLDQVRRIERAGLLFLASIAPGVAERHIAALEAQERAERARREADERAERERREAAEREAAEATATAVDGAVAAVEGEHGDLSEGAAGSEGQQTQQQPVAAT